MSLMCPTHKTKSIALHCLGLSLAAAPSAAFAHPETQVAANALAGLLHPLLGIDHLLVMLAVGLWAATLGPVAMRTLPLAFPLAMLTGALLAHENIALPMVEPMIGLSVLLAGIAVARGVRWPMTVSAATIAAFAVFHGYAHAVEAPAQGFTVSYAMGFVVATLLLHLAGLGIGTTLVRNNRSRFFRVGGSVIAGVGAALLIF